MQEVGHAFESILNDSNSKHSIVASSTGHKIHWFQIYIYDFGFGQLPRPKHWHSIVLDNVTKEHESELKQLQVIGHRLLWEMNIPFDHDKLWDLRGAYFFFHVLRWNHRFCEHFVRMPEFRQFIANVKVDLVVVDHFIQECFTMAASLLNASVTVQFSNWPIADGYIASFNLPSPPSAYPMTGTAFSPSHMGNFMVRLRNTIWHAIVMGARLLQGQVAKNFYASIGQPEMDLHQIESGHLFYGGRAEFLAEPVRPISNRIKHFGCAQCKGPEDYFILRTNKDEIKTANSEKKFGPNIPSSSTPMIENYTNNCLICANTSSTQRVLSEDAVISERYKRIRQEWPEVDWQTLERRTFVLVSFGSMAKVEFMPIQLLRLFLRAYANSPHLILWQTNSVSIKEQFDAEQIELPPNVRLLHWAPIKTLLGHPNLRLAILHGGVNTINEALMFGIPILGIPLQGDQPSNLQRLVDLGMAEQLDIRAVWAGLLDAKMAQMEQHHAKYAARARKVAAMIGHYRSELGGGQQAFWLGWAAKHRDIVRTKGHRFFDLFYRPASEYFALTHFGTFGLIILFILVILSR